MKVEHGAHMVCPLQVVLLSASSPTASSSSSLAVGFTASDKPSLFSSVPALSNVLPASFDLSFALSGPGTLHYRIYRAAVFVRHAGTQVVYANTLCSAERSLATNASDFESGMVAGGEVAVLGTDARTVTIAPDCIGQVCSITPAALVASTAYKVRCMGAAQEPWKLPRVLGRDVWSMLKYM
jgi:hypothetical protein